MRLEPNSEDNPWPASVVSRAGLTFLSLSFLICVLGIGPARTQEGVLTSSYRSHKAEDGSGPCWAGLGGQHCPSRCPGPACAGRRRNVNCLKNVVIWYEDHKHRCPYEPHLAELDPTFGLYTTAVWQCEAGHRYFQDLHSPLKPLSDSDPESDKGGSAGGAERAHHGLWGLGPCQHQASITDLTASNTALVLGDRTVLKSVQSPRAGPHSAKGPPGCGAVCPRSGAGGLGSRNPAQRLEGLAGAGPLLASLFSFTSSGFFSGTSPSCPSFSLFTFSRCPILCS